jgi:peptidoglycan/xylan/chitin deacetylase (PgdA/CDA1 family)
MIAPHFWRESKARFFKKDLFFVATPWWLRLLYPRCVWSIKTKEKSIYLTFDDGPHPVITPLLLNQLKQYNAKATFFCIGDNVKKFPEIYQRVIDEGHAIGNHTMHHINGWKHNDDHYLNDVAEAGSYIRSSIFRPPYGRAKKSQINKLLYSKAPVTTIMWSVLAGDWIDTLSPQKCFEQVKKNIHPGSIVVFHDSEKANDRMSYAVPLLLEYFSKQGYSFKKIELNIL